MEQGGDGEGDEKSDTSRDMTSGKAGAESGTGERGRSTACGFLDAVLPNLETPSQEEGSAVF